MLYEALDSTRHEIRILLLLPDSDFDSTLQCRLVTKSLDDEHLSYDALSYVWGSPTPAQNIDVDGEICEVGPNLHSALRRLRLKDDVRSIWVDALCINQKNNDEKSHQVAQMGRIYSEAEQTVAWLGDHESGKLAMELAKRIDENLSIEQLMEICHDKSLTHSWKAVHELTAMNEYWSRVWITQEVVLSDRLIFHCGAGVCSWKKLSGVVNIKKLTVQQLLESPAGYTWVNVNILESLVRLYQRCRRDGKMSLFDCLLDTRN